jgi:hypothetical protein
MVDWQGVRRRHPCRWELKQRRRGQRSQLLVSRAPALVLKLGPNRSRRSLSIGDDHAVTLATVTAVIMVSPASTISEGSRTTRWGAANGSAPGALFCTAKEAGFAVLPAGSAPP